MVSNLSGHIYVTILNYPGNSTRTSSKPSVAYSIPRGSHLREDGLSHYITLADLEVATERFVKKIGRGSFGSVFYGRMKDGKEVAVKIMDDSSSNGHQQFATEVPCCFSLCRVLLCVKYVSITVYYKLQNIALHLDTHPSFMPF